MIENLKNPKVGIASFICMIISILILIIGFIIIIVSLASHKYELALAGGFSIVMSFFISIGGVITGIIACCSSQKYKKTLSITSLSINSFLSIIVLMLYIIGLLSK